jgi:hypothetical protein
MATFTREESGRIGARRRWGPPRVLRLDSLDPEHRRIILAIVDLFAPTKEAVAVSDSPATAEEVRRVSDEHSSAA